MAKLERAFPAIPLMNLGDLRAALAELAGLPDSTPVRADTTKALDNHPRLSRYGLRHDEPEPFHCYREAAGQDVISGPTLHLEFR